MAAKHYLKSVAASSTSPESFTLDEMPKLMLTYSCLAEAVGDYGNVSAAGLGFATATDEVSVGSGGPCSFGIDDSRNGIVNSMFYDAAESTESLWYFSSFNCTPNPGVTITKYAASQVQIASFIALAGGAGFKAKVGTLNARTNAQGAGDVVVTGVGFQPQLVMFIWAKTSGYTDIYDVHQEGGPSFGFGAASSTSSGNQYAHHAYNTYLGGCTGTATVHKNGVCGVFLDASGTIQANMTLASFDSDGFTVTFDSGDYLPATTYGNTIDGRLIGYVALRDPNGGFHVGQSTQKTSTGSQAYTGAGFQPDLVMLTHGNGASSGTVATNAGAFTIGAFDANSQSCIVSGRTYGRSLIDYAIEFVTGTTGVAWASPTSLDSDGFTLNWISTDGASRPFGWIAMKTAGLSEGCGGYTGSFSLDESVGRSTTGVGAPAPPDAAPMSCDDLVPAAMLCDDLSPSAAADDTRTPDDTTCDTTTATGQTADATTPAAMTCD